MVDSHGADGVRLSTRATMTDGATRCRLLLLEIDDLECHLRFPAYAAHLQTGRPGVGLRFSARGCPDQSSRAIGGLLDRPCCWSNPFATSSCKPSVRQDSGLRQPPRGGSSFLGSSIAIRSPIQRITGTAMLLPSALYLGPSGDSGFLRQGILV